MTTVVAVRKGSQVVIAADTLVTFGDTRLSNAQEDNRKVFEVDGAEGRSLFAASGSVAHFPALRHALAAIGKDGLRLRSRDEIYRTFTKVHPLLKESFFLQTKEEEHDPYESSQFSLLLANATGIYGVYSYREVFEFKQFWSIGSGRSFALGAMHAVYAKARSAREVADAGIAAGCEFDRNSAGPADVLTLKLKASS